MDGFVEKKGERLAIPGKKLYNSEHEFKKALGAGKDRETMKEFHGSQNYVADQELLQAVNIAMVLQKPLLIKGEPGTGKTMLAEAISQALGKKLIIWNIKSTTKAQDGLYVYDVVQLLYDSQFGGQGVDNI